MRRVILSALLLAGLAQAATPEDKNVLVMNTEDSGLWRSFEGNRACLGLRAVTMSDREPFRWSLAIAGNGRGKDEVLLIEMPTKHDVFFGTNISKGVSHACTAIKQDLKLER
jgi:hypothetical protein